MYQKEKNFNWLKLLFILVDIISIVRSISTCHSCFNGCDNIDECDCTSTTKNESCRGDYCYVKLDRLSDDGRGAIRKGCVNVAPSKYVDVCQYVTNNRSIECYCQGDQCNTVSHFHNYQIEPLPMVSCCECDGYNYENGTLDCLSDTCLRNCTGNYCFNDIVRQSQGCGWGYSLAWQFLRNTHRVDRPRLSNSTAELPWPWDTDGGDMTCTEAYSDINTLLRGCTCSYDFCNIFNVANMYVRNETEVRVGASEHYCYAVHATSKKPITADVFKKSTSCPGHYCFVTYTTTVLSYGSSVVKNSSIWDNRLANSTSSDHESDARPKLDMSYELIAGCLLVDDEKKVETGCTTEYFHNASRPTKKHCICNSHICNYYNLITGQDRHTFLAFDWRTSNDYKTIAPISAAKSNSLVFSWTFLPFLIKYLF